MPSAASLLPPLLHPAAAGAVCRDNPHCGKDGGGGVFRSGRSRGVDLRCRRRRRHLSRLPDPASSTPAPHLSTAAAVQTRWPFPSRRTPPLPPSMSSLPRRRALPFTRGGYLSGTISAGSGRDDRRQCFSDGATFCRGALRHGGVHPSRAPRQSFAQAMIFLLVRRLKMWVNGDGRRSTGGTDRGLPRA